MFPLHRFARCSFARQPLASAIQTVCLSLLFAVPVSLPSAARAETRAVQQYDIQAGPLGKTLATFAASSGIALSFDPALTEGRTSAGLKGNFSVKDGFNKLLANSGLQVVAKPDGSYSLVTAPAPQTTPKTSSVLPAVTVSASGIEASGRGPVQGYSARRTETGTKTDTPLKDIPQTINVVTRDELRDRGVKKINEAFAGVPGAQPGTGYGGLANGRAIYLRGFLADTDFRDGFRDFSFVSPRDVAMFERIEVLKGPGSVLYGTNDPGGAVNYVTKRPTFETLRELSLTLGSFDERRIEADFSGALTEGNSLAYRLVAAYDEGDSHRDYVDHETQVLAPSLTWNITQDTQLTLLTEFVKHDYLFERGFLMEPEFLGLPIDRFLEEPDLNYAETESQRYTLELEHRFNEDWSLRTAASYLKPEMEKLNMYPMGLQADRRTLDRSVDYSKEYQKDRAIQVELTGRFSTDFVEHTLMSGVEYYRSNFHYTFAPFDVSSPIDIYDPIYGQVIIPDGFFDIIAFGNDYGSRTTAYYIQDQLTFSEQWKATIGARYDDAELFNDDLVNSSSSMEEQTRSKTSPRAGLVYQPWETTTFFTGYSTSFRPQIFNLNSNGELPKPETGEQIELGWRQDWLDQSLNSTLSIFDITKQNVSATDPADSRYTIQVGEQRSRGVELEVRGNITPALSTIIAAAHIDAEVTKDIYIPKGDTLNIAPADSASLWLKYQPQPVGWFAGGGINYIGERESGLPNNGMKLPDETTLDAMAGYAAVQWAAQLNLHNLTDEETYVPFASSLFIPGAGRSLDLTVSTQF